MAGFTVKSFSSNVRLTQMSFYCFVFLLCDCGLLWTFCGRHQTQFAFAVHVLRNVFVSGNYQHTPAQKSAFTKLD